MKVSVVLPCKNEENSIGVCIEKTIEAFKNMEEKNYEIIVSDSSTDRSAKIAMKFKKVKVVKHNLDGYGNALLKGIENAKGDYIIIGDADNTYDFLEIPKFIEQLNKGHDLVIGSRLKGKIEKGAMPFSHRYFGTPIMNFLLKLFFRKKVTDCNSGFRAIKKKALKKLELRTTGMEFASEMIIKAIKSNLKIKEIPIAYSKRIGNSKLRSFSDGWKHLRFMLLYSPLFLFFIPGLILFLFGIETMLWFYFGADISGVRFYYYPMFLSLLLIILGYQLIIFALFAKTYAINHLGEKPIFENLYKHITIEKASIFGISIIFLGIIIYLMIFLKWLGTEFQEFTVTQTKNSIIAFTLIVMGIQTIFSSFMLSILGIKEK